VSHEKTQCGVDGRAGLAHYRRRGSKSPPDWTCFSWFACHDRGLQSVFSSGWGLRSNLLGRLRFTRTFSSFPVDLEGNLNPPLLRAPISAKGLMPDAWAMSQVGMERKFERGTQVNNNGEAGGRVVDIGLSRDSECGDVAAPRLCLCEKHYPGGRLLSRR